MFLRCTWNSKGIFLGLMLEFLHFNDHNAPLGDPSDVLPLNSTLVITPALVPEKLIFQLWYTF